MATYLVSYDLVGQKDYERLFEHLRTYGTRSRPLKSLWVIVTSKTAEEIRNGIDRYIDDDDKVLVVRTGQGAAWRHLSKETGDWLRKWIYSG